MTEFYQSAMTSLVKKTQVTIPSSISNTETHFQAEKATTLINKTESSNKSEFAQELEFQINFIEKASFELNSKRAYVISEFKKTETEIGKSDKKLQETIKLIKETIESITEQSVQVYFHHSSLFTKMLEKDANYKRQTVAMIMNLEADMKKYKGKDEPRQELGTRISECQKSTEDDSSERISCMFKHKEQIIRKLKSRLACKSQGHNLLLLKKITEKNFFEKIIKEFMEKSSENKSEFDKSVDNFREKCESMSFEFKNKEFVKHLSDGITDKNSLNESGFGIKKSNLFRIINKKKERLIEKKLIFEQQNEKLEKLQNKFKNLGSDNFLIENAKKEEILGKENENRDKIKTEIKKLENQVQKIKRSVFGENKMIGKIINNELCKSFQKSKNREKMEVFLGCTINQQALLQFRKKKEIGKSIAGFHVILNYFEKNCQTKAINFSKDKKNTLKKLESQKDSKKSHIHDLFQRIEIDTGKKEESIESITTFKISDNVISSSPRNPQKVEMTHAFIQNLSEKLAESKTETLEAENKKQIIQKKLEDEIKEMSNELNRKNNQLKLKQLENEKMKNKVEYFSQAIKGLEDTLIFERSKYDVLKKRLIDLKVSQVQVEQLKNESGEKSEEPEKGSYSNFSDRKTLVIGLDKRQSWTGKQTPNKSSKVENYFQKIKKQTGENSEAQNEPKINDFKIEDSPENSKKNVAIILNVKPVFKNSKTEIQISEKNLETSLNIYKTKPEMEYQLETQKNQKIEWTQRLNCLYQRFSKQNLSFENQINDLSEKLAGIADKFDVIEAFSNKFLLIVEIFRTRSPESLLILINQSFQTLSELKDCPLQEYSKQDLIITNKLLKTQNSILDAKLRVLMRENTKFRTNSPQGRNSAQLIIRSSVTNSEDTPHSRKKPLSNSQQTNKSLVYPSNYVSLNPQPTFSPKETNSEIKKSEEQIQETISSKNKRLSKKPKNYIFEIGNDFEQETSHPQSLQPLKRNLYPESQDAGNFSFSIQNYRAKFEKAVLSPLTCEPHIVEGIPIKSNDNSNVDKSQKQLEGNRIISGNSNPQSAKNEFELKPQNCVGYLDNKSDERPQPTSADLDESLDSLFYKKVIENFYPESNEDSIYQYKTN